MGHFSCLGRSFATLIIPALAVAQSAGAEPVDHGVRFDRFLGSVCLTGNATGGVAGGLASRCSEIETEAEEPPDPGDPLADQAEPLSTDSQNALTPTQTLSSNENVLFRAQALNRQIVERLDERRRLDDDEADASNSAPISSLSFDSGAVSAFLNVRGTWFDRDPRPKERGFDGTTVSVQLGGDYRVSERFVAGGLFAYDRTDSTFDPVAPGGPITLPSDSGDTEANTYVFMVFGSYSVTDAWWIDGSIGGGFSSYTFTRQGTFQLSNRPTGPGGALARQTAVRTRGTPDGSEVSLSVGTGWDGFDRGPLNVGPYVRLNYVRSRIDGYQETDTLGSGLNLSIDENVRTSLTSVLGLRGSYALSTEWGVVVPQLRVEWEHEYDRLAQVSSVIFVNDVSGASQRFSGTNPDRDYANVGASVVMIARGGWMPFVDYEGLFGYTNLTRHRLTGGLRKEF